MVDTHGTDVMSLSDIAALAHVQRPVVSMWRQRTVLRGEPIPFPDPVATSGGELFAMSAVVAWLEATGRGNNPDARADALAHARPIVRLDDDLRAAALEALLCLKARSGIDLSEASVDEIASEARELDPDDDHLQSEVKRAGDELRELADYAERLADAMWDAPTAFDRVRVGSTGHRPGLTLAALQLLGAAGAAVALDGGGEVVITDPLSSDSDVVDSVLTHLGEGIAAHVLVEGDCVASRAARRLHWTKGRSVVDSAPSGTLPLVITRVPVGGADSDPASVLAAADDIQLDLHEQQRALIVGPASVLCDGLSSGDLDQQRDHLIRLGRLRCALRLPHGLVSDGSRQVLGLWVLGGEPASVQVEARRLATADLTNEPVRPDVVDDVATDVVASLTEPARATHAFRYARLHSTATLLAGVRPLVTPGSGPERVSGESAAARTVMVRQLLSDLDEDATPQPFLDGLTIDPGQDPATTGLLSVDEALRAGLASVHSGSRIGPAPRSATGVRIIDADAVTDPDQPRRGLDPLDLEAIAPRALRTEPGDVVFCVSPTPAAVVDQEGLSVVAYPARIIRCAPDKGLVPEAVAQAINDLPPRAPRWRAWRVPRMPVDQAHSLRAALRRIADEEMRARQRITRLDALAHELTDGVAAGALTITPDPTEEGL